MAAVQLAFPTWVEVRERHEALVVGAGAAGLATAAMLRRRGIPALVLERSEQVGSSWRSRYDSLILNTPRFTSTLAGYRMPRRYGRWVKRDHVIEYLEEYARREEVSIHFGVEVRRVERQDGAWSLDTSDGRLRSSHVVIATGHDIRPITPDWPGREDFPGPLIHSAEYRNAEPFRGREVLVVSASNSGSEIANELVSSGASKVTVSMRTPLPVWPREFPRGMPVNYVTCMVDDFLSDRAADRIGSVFERLMYPGLPKHGLPRSPVGAQTRMKHQHKGLLLDSGFVKAFKKGRIELVPAVSKFEGGDVVLVDGRRLRPDAIIAATGFERGLEPLVGHLGVLEPDGFPAVLGAETHPGAPGLYFNGYRGTISGQLRYMRRHARAIARAIARGRQTRVAGGA
jgi:putative flavoprotein involved in K+ transport